MAHQPEYRTETKVTDNGDGTVKLTIDERRNPPKSDGTCDAGDCTERWRGEIRLLLAPDYREGFRVCERHWAKCVDRFTSIFPGRSVRSFMDIKNTIVRGPHVVSEWDGEALTAVGSCPGGPDCKHELTVLHVK